MSQSSALGRRAGRSGRADSYVFGFFLSLGLTIMAYVLVTSGQFAGTGLLGSILTLAVIQMLGQIYFFLHLGRGPKPLYNLVFFGATAGVILVVVGGSVFIINNLYSTMSPGDVTLKRAQDEGLPQVSGLKTGACLPSGVNHTVTISNSGLQPFAVTAKACDNLTFINQSAGVVDLAFGPHPEHRSYGGQPDLKIKVGYPKTIILNQSGEFSFHDHQNPRLSGRVTVTP